MKKSFSKLIILSLLLFLIIPIFSACSQVRVMTITNEDGSIDELVAISLNREEIQNSTYNINEIKQEIETVSALQINAMIDALNQKVAYDMLMTADFETREVINSYKDGIQSCNTAWQNDSIIVGIRFKNVDVYRYYYNIKENAKVEMETEHHFFYDKIYYHSNTMYVKHKDLYLGLNQYFGNKYPELVNSENNQLLYTYKTSKRRQHSDADFVTKQNGEYYHTWVVDQNEIEKPIMLYYNVANTEVFIILSIVVSIAVGAVLLIVGLIQKNIKNRKQKKEDN